MARRYEEGDLVWARATGHGWWPGQVMDPARVPENIQKQARAKTQLLSFFGDMSYGWFDLDCLEPFEPNYAARSKQNPKSQKGKLFFRRAVEEAREVCDRRAGRGAATSHNPVDFLRYETWPPSMLSGDTYALKLELPPYPPPPRLVEGCSGREALLWLAGVAAAPEEAGKVGAALASSAAALVWAAEHAVALAVHGPNARRLAFTTTTTTTTKRRNSKHEAASGSQGVKEGQQEQDEADPAAAAAAATGKQSASQGPGARRHKTLKAHQLAFGTTVKQVDVREMVAKLRALALAPERDAARGSDKLNRYTAVLLRWRETYHRSGLRKSGFISPLLRQALEAVGALQQVGPAPQAPGESKPGAKRRTGGAAGGAGSGSLGYDSDDYPAPSNGSSSSSGGSQEPSRYGQGAKQEPPQQQAHAWQDGGLSDSSSSDQEAQAARGRGTKRRGGSSAATSALLEDKAAAKRARLDAAAGAAPPPAAARRGRRVDAPSDSSSEDDGAAGGGEGGAGAAGSGHNMVTVVVKEYQHRIPDSKEKFNCDLQNWYGERGIAPLTPSVAGHDWDHYTIFKLVADKGGAEATTQRKAWRSVAQKWHPEVAKRSNIGSIMKHNYEKTLGAFETWLTAGVPTLVKHFKALAPGPVAGAAAAAWAAAAGPAGSRPGVALPPTGQQRRALLMREQTGVASSGAAGSTSIGSTSHQAGAARRAPSPPPPPPPHTQEARRIAEDLPQPPPGALVDPELLRVLVRLASAELMPEGKLLVEVAQGFCPTMQGHDIKMNRSKAIIVFEFPTPAHAWRAEQGLRNAPRLLGLAPRDVARVVRVSVAVKPKGERQADRAADNSMQQQPLPLPPPPPPLQQHWQPQQHPYQQQQQEVLPPPPGAHYGMDGRPLHERQYDGYLGVRMGPGPQQPPLQQPPQQQQHMYGYGEPPPGLPPGAPHLQHLPPQPPQLHLQQPLAVPHDPRRPLGPPPGLPPGPHMPLGGLPPGLGGAVLPAAPMDPRQRGAAGGPPLPQVLVAAPAPVGGMSSPAVGPSGAPLAPPLPTGPPPPAGEEGGGLGKMVGGLDISRLMTILGTVAQQPAAANGVQQQQQQQPPPGAMLQGLLASFQPAAVQPKVEPKLEPKQEPYC